MQNTPDKKQKRIANIDGLSPVPRQTEVRIRKINTSIVQHVRSNRVIRAGSDVIKNKQNAVPRLQFIVPLFAPRAPHIFFQTLVILRRRTKIIRKRLQSKFRSRIAKHAAMPKYALGLAILAIMASFGGGMYLEWSSKQSSAYAVEQEVLGTAVSADTEPQDVLSADQAMQSFLALLSAKPPNQNQSSEYLVRKQKLQRYLQSKRSPLSRDDKALDALLHAKNLRMVLAISFVESNFCEHYVDYNCSGIGVEPGHPSWQVYKSFANWVIGLDSLLERRYKNWTPEEMRGVYVYPGSDNWVNGVKDVLAELQKAGVQ